MTNGFTSCSNGSSMLMPTERRRPSGSTECAPSFAACMRPGPPPVRMSQPIAGQLRGELFHALVGGRARLEARGAEDGHAIVLARGAAQAGEVVDDFPQAGDGAFEERDGGVFVAEFDDVGLSEGLRLGSYG